MIHVERRTKKSPEFQIGIKLSTQCMSYWELKYWADKTTLLYLALTFFFFFF